MPLLSLFSRPSLTRAIFMESRDRNKGTSDSIISVWITTFLSVNTAVFNFMFHLQIWTLSYYPPRLSSFFHLWLKLNHVCLLQALSSTAQYWMSLHIDEARPPSEIQCTVHHVLQCLKLRYICHAHFDHVFPAVWTVETTHRFYLDLCLTSGPLLVAYRGMWRLLYRSSYQQGWSQFSPL